MYQVCSRMNSSQSYIRRVCKLWSPIVGRKPKCIHLCWHRLKLMSTVEGVHTCVYMKSFIAKHVSILVNLRYLRFTLLKYKENNKNICNTFDHNFKNIPLYINEQCIIRKVLFGIIRWCPYLKNVKNGA